MGGGRGEEGGSGGRVGRGEERGERGECKEGGKEEQREVGRQTDDGRVRGAKGVVRGEEGVGRGEEEEKGAGRSREVQEVSSEQ